MFLKQIYTFVFSSLMIAIFTLSVSGALANTAQKGPIVAGTIAANGSVAVSMTDHPDHMLLFFDPSTGKGLRRVPTGQIGLQTAIALSPDGKLVACGTNMYGGANHELVILDVSNGKPLHQMRLHKPQMEYLNLSVLDLQFSPDSKQLLVTTNEEMVFVFDPVSGKQLRYFQVRVGSHSGTSAAWLPDGKRILLGSSSGAALVDTTTGKILKKYSNLARAEILDISADGRYAVASNRSDIAVFDVVSGKVLSTLKNVNLVTGVVIAANAPLVACTDVSHKFVTLYNAKTGAQLKRVEVPENFLNIPGWTNLKIGGLSIDNQTRFLVVNSPALPYIIPLGGKK